MRLRFMPVHLALGLMLHTAFAQAASAQTAWDNTVPVNPSFVLPADFVKKGHAPRFDHKDPNVDPDYCVKPTTPFTHKHPNVPIKSTTKLSNGYVLVTLEVDVGRHFVVPSKSSHRYEVVAKWAPDRRDRLSEFRLQNEIYDKDPPKPEPTLFFFSWSHVTGRSPVKIEVARSLRGLAKPNVMTDYVPQYHYYNFVLDTLFGSPVSKFFVRASVILADGSEGHIRTARVERKPAGWELTELP